MRGPSRGGGGAGWQGHVRVPSAYGVGGGVRGGEWQEGRPAQVEGAGHAGSRATAKVRVGIRVALGLGEGKAQRRLGLGLGAVCR